MPDQIRDGTGRAYLARVNLDNELAVRATSVEERLAAAIDQQYYEATTGKVTLTDANETGLIYMYNGDTASREIVIDRVFWDIWTSTGGTGEDGTLTYYKNPTITGGTDIVPNNTHFTAQTAAPGTYKKSLTTMTGTAWWLGYITDKQSIALEEGRIVMPAGTSFGISVAAPTGNTSMVISVNVAFYFFNPEILLGE